MKTAFDGWVILNGEKYLVKPETCFGTVRLYERQKRRWKLIDDVRAGSVGCEYGEYGKK